MHSTLSNHKSAVLLILALAALPAAANMVKIVRTGSTYPTIGAAVDAAQAGDTLNVSTGVYQEFVLVTNGLSIVGGYDTDCTTVLLGERSMLSHTATISFWASPTTNALKNFVVTGSIDSGVNAVDVLLLRCESCIVSNNAATLGDKVGGGFYIYNATVVLSNTVVQGNRAWLGGGAGVRMASRFVMEDADSAVAGNVANMNGGGVYTLGSTLSNCFVAGNSSSNEGGGVYCLGDGGVIAHCSILSNTAVATGGGVTLSNGNPLIMHDCVIGWNDCTNDAGTAEGGGVFLSAATGVRNCLIVSNSADIGSGIRMVMPTNRCVVVNCRIVGNLARVSGGGISAGNLFDYLFSRPGAMLITNCLLNGNTSWDNGGGGALIGGVSLCDCLVSSNEAAVDGGGVLVMDLATNDWAGIHRCTIVGNRAEMSAGALIVNSTMDNSIIVGNTANDMYGGMRANNSTIRSCLVANNGGPYCGGICLLGSCAENCTISGNAATNVSAAVELEDTNAVMRNCIIYYNTPCDIEWTFPITNPADNCVACCTSTNIIGTLCITNEPAFVSIGGNDFRLQSGSPCRDAGTNQPWMADATDLDGIPRIMPQPGGTVDMGCYEVVPEPVAAGAATVIGYLLFVYRIRFAPIRRRSDRSVRSVRSDGSVQSLRES